MNYSIHQINDTTWELRAEDGTVVATFTSANGRTGYDCALMHLSSLIRGELAVGDQVPTDGLLPDTWTDDGGIAFAEALPGGRDFSDVAWSWRDPEASLLPLMLQTETEFGHFGAELAGFFTDVSEASGTVHASGRFYDSETGRAARDLLLDGRRFGVSVDPTEAVDVEEDFTCTEFDDEGFCVDGIWRAVFHAYEIGGLTMTPFPAFERASIVLQTAGADNETETPEATAPAASRVVAAVAARPPAAWFALTEPQPGAPFLDGRGDDVLIEQGDGTVACPLTITEDGQVYGHIARGGR